MIKIKKILLPVDFPSPSLNVIHQAASLAHHFRSEIVMMHVVTALSHSAGVPEDSAQLHGWDMLAEITKEAEKEQDRSLEPELNDIAVRWLLTKGDAAYEIVRAAQEEEADLIMMPSYGHTFSQFLLGSVTAKVLHGTECPVWTDAHVKLSSMKKFAIRNILCAVDLSACDHKSVSWAAEMASEFDARLTLAYVTPGVEMWGPGGNYVNAELKEALVGNASNQMARLQREMGITADVFICSGDVPKGLSQAAKQIGADLLITGCRPYGGHLRTHGYSIICAVPIPVLNV